MSATTDDGALTYLRANRDFLAPTVARVIASLDLPRGGTFLDAGTGAGGALVPLAESAGADGRVIAVDLNPRAVEAARAYAHTAGSEDRIDVLSGDVRTVLAGHPGALDAVWAGDMVWPGHFDEPGEVVKQFAAALRPGGRCALFSSNYYQAMFLPGHSVLERKLRTASELRWRLPADGPWHHERHVSWLQSAGLERVAIHVVPRVAFPLAEDEAARRYLEHVVWPELLESATKSGHAAGMTDAEIRAARRLLSPSSPDYVLRCPGHYVVHPTITAIGHAPA